MVAQSTENYLAVGMRSSLCLTTLYQLYTLYIGSIKVEMMGQL